MTFFGLIFLSFVSVLRIKARSLLWSQHFPEYESHFPTFLSLTKNVKQNEYKEKYQGSLRTKRFVDEKP